jgi:isopentenyl phosphate kinase
MSFARLGVRSWILDGTVPGALSAALAGKHQAGTRITP